MVPRWLGRLWLRWNGWRHVGSGVWWNPRAHGAYFYSYDEAMWITSLAP